MTNRLMINKITTTQAARDYCTYEEFAERISCSPRYVAELSAKGFLPTVKLGRRCVRIPIQRALDKMAELEVEGAA